MTATADLAIRLARAAFNRALAEADLASIGPLLAMDVVMVTGTDSAVIAGRKAQLMAWKREFAAKPRMIYTRTPESIVASPVEPIAMEHGVWQGVVDGVIQASGSYSAKWRGVGGRWVIEAELYLTLA
ncbi:nuclear transport factor 2 family protein [Sphingomonas sp. VDB2]|uniref:nuclear transport factor 2 family protein n=1 Tax=Sphingomonas sp. VDB2 TaxID=3228751 RepID=UPI003A802BC6